MKTIWKYQVPTAPGEWTAIVPVLHEFIGAEMRGGSLTLWAIVEPETRKVDKVVRVVATGQELPFKYNKHHYVGSVHDSGVDWHVFVM